jgi:hypothetical protein
LEKLECQAANGFRRVEEKRLQLRENGRCRVGGSTGGIVEGVDEVGETVAPLIEGFGAQQREVVCEEGSAGWSCGGERLIGQSNAWIMSILLSFGRESGRGGSRTLGLEAGIGKIGGWSLGLPDLQLGLLEVLLLLLFSLRAGAHDEGGRWWRRGIKSDLGGLMDFAAEI